MCAYFSANHRNVSIENQQVCTLKLDILQLLLTIWWRTKINMKAQLKPFHCIKVPKCLNCFNHIALLSFSAQTNHSVPRTILIYRYFNHQPVIILLSQSTCC